MREMHAYLMRPAGLQNEAQERDIASWGLAGKDVEHLIMRLCLATLLSASDGDFHSVAAAPSEPGVDDACRPGEPAPHEREIAAV